MIPAKIAIPTIGAGLLAMAFFTPALAAQQERPMDDGGEIPLGLLIKTPETPHGVSFGTKVAHLGSHPAKTQGVSRHLIGSFYQS